MFILASGSPRRRELLQQIGASFEVVVSEAEELSGASLPPGELVKENAVRKAEAVAHEHPGLPVLGADTVVFWMAGYSASRRMKRRQETCCARCRGASTR